ncbi:hypothetical protein THERMOS_1441 [Bathymodiolus thermophilus thioautotrophic gill symbiont]|uniref:Uncharacterized protein n=1 Tax=Bathymodiolus thermophilus thioautotrophic gill symbiont TaxID=2360 RepID=A0A8H8XDZ4_9GAMM|nr:hypothetical protein THERMOS_1441 [Bathymodiolus thermophilus thioautotrophic gill symbiont]
MFENGIIYGSGQYKNKLTKSIYTKASSIKFNLLVFFIRSI